MVALIAWTALVTKTASARIGWTLEECRKHYGQETPCTPPTPEITDFFTVGKIQLADHFADGKMDSIIYIRYKSEGDFPDEERKALMDRNCGELSWDHSTPWFRNEYWVSQDGKFVAVRVRTAGYAFWIHTRQFDLNRQKSAEEAATSKLQGL